MDPAWRVGGAREHIASSLCEVGGPASMINLPQCVLMCFCKSSVCVQLKSQYACMPHSPTRRDPSLPGRWVRCAWVGRGTRGNYLPYVSVTLLPLSWTTFPKFEPILLKNFKMYDCFFYIKIFFFIICVNLLFLLARLTSKND